MRDQGLDRVVSSFQLLFVEGDFLKVASHNPVGRCYLRVLHTAEGLTGRGLWGGWETGGHSVCYGLGASGLRVEFREEERSLLVCCSPTGWVLLLVSYKKNLSRINAKEVVPYVFFTSFKVSGHVYIISPFPGYSCEWCTMGSNFASLHVAVQPSGTFVEETPFPVQCSPFSNVGACVCGGEFWGLNVFVGLCVCFYAVPYCLDHYSFVGLFGIGKCVASGFVLSQGSVGYLGSFMSLYKSWGCSF